MPALMPHTDLVFTIMNEEKNSEDLGLKLSTLLQEHANIDSPEVDPDNWFTYGPYGIQRMFVKGKRGNATTTLAEIVKIVEGEYLVTLKDVNPQNFAQYAAVQRAFVSITSPAAGEYLRDLEAVAVHSR